MYQVTNKTNDQRQFWSKGSNIVVGPGLSVLTSKPPLSSDVWEVKLFEEIVTEQKEIVQPEKVQKKQTRNKK